MAFTHNSGWTPPSGRQLKSCTTIDEETLQLFKSICIEKAAFYERHYVAQLGKHLADEIAAQKMLESIERYEGSKRRW